MKERQTSTSVLPEISFRNETYVDLTSERVQTPLVRKCSSVLSADLATGLVERPITMDTRLSKTAFLVAWRSRL